MTPPFEIEFKFENTINKKEAGSQYECNSNYLTVGKEVCYRQVKISNYYYIKSKR